MPTHLTPSQRSELAALLQTRLQAIERQSTVHQEGLSLVEHAQQRVEDGGGSEEDLVEELRNRARDTLLIKAIATEEQLESTEPTEELLSMEGMDRQTALQLASRGVSTVEDLAELSIDEMLELEGMDEERAGQLIMIARRPWFAEG